MAGVNERNKREERNEENKTMNELKGVNVLLHFAPRLFTSFGSFCFSSSVVSLGFMLSCRNICKARSKRETA